MLGRLTKERVQELGDVLGDCMGWGTKQKNDEVEYALNLLRDRHGVKI